jgi:hypothetical protein
MTFDPTLLFRRKPKPVVPASVPVTGDRERPLIDELHRIDAQLDAVHYQMRKFRKERTVIMNGAEYYLADKLTDRDALASLWGDYLKQVGALINRRNQILKEYAELHCPMVLKKVANE